MNWFIRACASLFDWLERHWQNHSNRRLIVDLLIVIFLGSLGLIELKRQGLLEWLPSSVSSNISLRHFDAIQVTFYSLLLFEVISLVFGLPKSESLSVRQQFEILGLILIRLSLEQLVELEEPISPEDVRETIVPILAYAMGGLALFGLIGVYNRIELKRSVTSDEVGVDQLFQLKKMLALIVLGGFAFLIVEDLYLLLTEGVESALNLRLFSSVYTLLIFSDVLMVFLSMRYSDQFRTVFRNFALTLATVLIRLALTAPRYFDIGIALAGMIYALLLSLLDQIYREEIPMNRLFFQPKRRSEIPASSQPVTDPDPSPSASPVKPEADPKGADPASG